MWRVKTPLRVLGLAARSLASGLDTLDKKLVDERRERLLQLSGATCNRQSLRAQLRCITAELRPTRRDNTGEPASALTREQLLPAEPKNRVQRETTGSYFSR